MHKRILSDEEERFEKVALEGGEGLKTSVRRRERAATATLKSLSGS